MTELLAPLTIPDNEPKTIEKVAIVVSKGSLEGIYPGLIMANGARMEGIEADLRGIKLRTFSYVDYGMPDFPGVVLVTKNETAKNGSKKLAKFLEVGCNTCHVGTAIGGRDFKKLGQAKAWPTEIKDNGRFDFTKDAADKNVFKVPSLRNVGKTGPYFHDGSVKTLEEAVKLMATHQLGKELSTEDVASIVRFLKSLTGELPKVDKPELPKSTAKTPKADPT